MGGAKNCPETPRQKMIGMMYLVLTAMLALNVSTDVLNGFKAVDDGLHRSVYAMETRNNTMLQIFETAAALNPEKNQASYDKALEVVAKSDSMFNYVKDFKYQLAILADGAEKADPEGREIEGKSNLDVTGQYGIVEGHGAELKQKLIDYRNYLIELSDSTKTNELTALFAMADGQTTDGTVISWEATIFEGMPVGATITLLTKIQNDIRTAEGAMIQYLQLQSDASDLRVNKMEVLVVPESKNVIRGDKYKAQIVLAAVDTTQKPLYFVNGSRIGDDGIYQVPTNSIGSFKYKGELRLKNNDGTEMSYPFESEYNVNEPSATISNTDLNVMYRGYQHKFSISVPGIADNKISVTASGGATVSRSGSLWSITPSNSAKNVEIAVSAEINGTKRAMGSQNYRILPLPTPAASVKVGDKEYAGSIWKSDLTKPGATVVAGYGADALISLDYTVTSFVLRVKGRILPATGNKFTDEQQKQLARLKSGDDVFIVAIKVKTKTGQTQELERGVALTIN